MNVLERLGVKKGDTISIYLPMTWQSVATFLACAHIGAVHSVVFTGFSSECYDFTVSICLRLLSARHVPFSLHSVAAVRPSELIFFLFLLVTLTDAMRSLDDSRIARNR